MQPLLFVLGLILFLLGLITGMAIPAMENPRMGLASHLRGVTAHSSLSSVCCGRISI